MMDLGILVSEELEQVNKNLADISINQADISIDLNKFLNGSSKRIRTVLTTLFLKANNKQISQDSITLMTVGEIIHNSSLLHDDVIDASDYRRGELTFAKKFTPHVSVLLGDYLLAIAVEMLLTIKKHDFSDIFLNATKLMCKAELEQFFLRGKNPDIDTYINICKGKTACLFEAILECCAINEDLDTKNAKDFANFFGIWFQLKNDLQTDSSENDAKNLIFTPKDILGIEKTKDLIDNYQKRILNIIGFLPDNIYKKGLEELLLIYDR